MFTKHLIKTLHIALSLQLTFSPLLASTFEDEVVARAKPNRSTSLIFTDPNRNRFSFEEFYLGSNGNDCFFNGLGVTRADAVDKVAQALARGSVITGQLLDNAIEDQIHEPPFAGLRHLSPKDKRAAYLEMYRSSALMIECAQNIGTTDAVGEHTVTLFDVFAYVYRRNISVYRPCPEAAHTLEAFHQVKYRECTQPTLHLLLKGSHFNRLLAPTQGLDVRVEALDAEARYLEELRQRVRLERAQDQMHVDQGGTSDDDLPPPLFCEMEARPPVQDDMPRGLGSAVINELPRTPHRASFEDNAPAPTPRAARRISVSRDTVIAFLLKKRAVIPGLTYEKSCKNVWVALDQLPSLYERFAGKATLLLDHDFTPRGQRRDVAIQKLIDRAPRALTQEKESHQLKIYLGRLLMEQRRFAAAWQKLAQTLERPKLSQVGRLYMAQMIIEHGYRPAHIADPIAYAQELLEASGENVTPGRSTAHSRPASMTPGYLHNPYLSERASLRTASALTQMVREESQQTREPRASTSQITRTPQENAHGTQAQAPRPSQKRLHKERAPSHSEDVRETRDPAHSPKRPRAQVRDQAPSPEEDRLVYETQEFPTPGTPIFDALPQPPRITITNTQGGDEDEALDGQSPHSPSQTLESGALSAQYTRAISLILKAKAVFLRGKSAAGQALCFEVFDLLDAANPRSAELSQTQRHKIMANVHLLLGNSQYTGAINGQYLTRTELYLHALDLATQIDDKDAQMRAFHGLGNACYSGPINGAIHKRCDCYLRALDLAVHLNDKDSQMRAFMGLGNSVSYEMPGEKEHNPSDYYARALDLAREVGDTSIQMSALLGLGHAHVDIKTPQVKEAKFSYFLQARDLAIAHGNRRARICALNGMGFMSNIPGCIKYYHEALALCGDDFPDLKTAVRKNLDAAHKALRWRKRQSR